MHINIGADECQLQNIYDIILIYYNIRVTWSLQRSRAERVRRFIDWRWMAAHLNN